MVASVSGSLNGPARAAHQAQLDRHEAEGDISRLADQSFRVRGDTPVTRVNEVFGVQLASEDAGEVFDTIGGLVAHDMGRVPRRGEQHQLAGLDFTTLHTKGGAVRWFRVTTHVSRDD